MIDIKVNEIGNSHSTQGKFYLYTDFGLEQDPMAGSYGHSSRFYGNQKIF
jgi:hypothetical protein